MKAIGKYGPSAVTRITLTAETLWQSLDYKGE
jgi:hypothetical protein